MGASGKIGRELVRRLAERGQTVRAVSRRAAGGEKLPGVEWVAADLAQPEGLAATFDGAERLFLLTGNSEDMVRLQKNAMDAARRTGLKQVVKLSALGATDHSKSVIALWHYNVERAVRESGLAWTFLRPHAFMDNLLDQRENILHDGVVYSASGEGRVPLIDARDIAAAAAVTLTEPGHDGKIYTLTGPQAVSYREVTEILSRVLGRPLRYVAETDDQAWVRLRRAGTPTWQVAALLSISSYQRQGGLTEKLTTTVQQLIGRPPHTFEQFARHRAAAFGGLTLDGSGR